MHNSIRLSCNSYYCHIFRMIIEHDAFGGPAGGLNHWAKRLGDFGSGVKLGIDIPNESKGIVPTSTYFDKIYRKNAWRALTIISLGIGQAEISLTPLQMANNAAIMANRGYYITPHFVRGVQTRTGIENMSWTKYQTGIDTSYYNLMANALHDVVEIGTARMARIKGVEVCGKTGTAQNPHGEDHALFIGFAPKNNPTIAICAVIENAGYGGSWAAPVASLVMEKYITDTIARPYVEKWVLDAAYLKKAEEAAKKDKDTKENE
ncbi:MAG: penicillin-binding transpeptidase domain-containing protein [Bacteroidota bacterium]|nr:penicillin-binding transpeptidase domain-containing protein [Bacteroidota bacterium]